MRHGNDQEETQNSQCWLQAGHIAQTHDGRRVRYHDTGVLQGNQRQEQANPGTDPQTQSIGDRVDDPLPYLEHAQDQESKAGEEYCAQRYLPAVAHAHHHPEGEESIQSHPRCLSDRIVGIEPHDETTEGRRQTGRHKDGIMIHTRFG